jgi:hypothetical protein
VEAVTDERLQRAIDAVVAPMHGYGTLDTDENYRQRRMSDWDALLIAISIAGWKFVTPEGETWTPPSEPRPSPGFGRML